jgi:hypothetical protein
MASDHPMPDRNNDKSTASPDIDNAENGPFILRSDVEKYLTDSDDDSGIIQISLGGKSELFVVEMLTDYSDEFKMFRIGSRFFRRGELSGLIYGFVFQMRRGEASPSPSIFYHWCDGVGEDIADLGRWILDSGRFTDFFASGDAVAIDAFEFLPEMPFDAQRLALEQVATALKLHFRRLGRALLVSHPIQFGEPPRPDCNAREAERYRAALEPVLDMLQGLRMSDRFGAGVAVQDIVIKRDRGFDDDAARLEMHRSAGR